MRRGHVAITAKDAKFAKGVFSALRSPHSFVVIYLIHPSEITLKHKYVYTHNLS